MAGRMNLETMLGQCVAPGRQQRVEDAPMRILVLVDASGREVRGVVEPGDAVAKRALTRLDVDTIDDVFMRLGARVALPSGDVASPTTEVSFSGVDQLRPDSLYQRLDSLSRLRDLRARLLEPRGFDSAASELAAIFGAELAGASGLPPSGADVGTSGRGLAAPSIESDSDTLARLLGRSASPERARPEIDSGAVARLVRNAIAPHVVSVDPRLPTYLAALEDRIAERLRAALRAPGFRALESSWLGLRMLVTGLETGADLDIRMLDVSATELTQDLVSSGGDVASWCLTRRLGLEAPNATGGAPFSIIVAAFEFGPGGLDAALLAALGSLAARSGACLLGGASPALLGCSRWHAADDPRAWELDPDDQARWALLRRSPLARSIGLALPRVLLRLPFGPRGEPVEAFPFDELGGVVEPGSFAWGNAAFAIALLLGRSYSSRGWAMEPGDERDLGDLPAYTHTVDGESQLVSCAEAMLSDRAVHAVLDRGLMAVAPYRGRNVVVVPRFQSIAEPVAPLAGPWAG